ncbi:MAG TPA: asparaginase [Gemmatimonadaceae bacterium]|nr:asparaginase [Gemmatimonadaceae bacterium]
MRYELDVVATRGGLVEARHRVHAAVVDEHGRLLGSARDPAMATLWRSCAKPFQAMAFVESGKLDDLDWSVEELALACASHGGEPEHVELARAMLESIGLEEGDLACGPHEPLTRRGQRALQQEGLPPTRLHNNCSGKHAAMLAFAHETGWPTLGYEAVCHPVQQHALERVSLWSGVPVEKIVQATDGCGVIAFGLPLQSMARAFARLGAAARRNEEVPARIVGAMLTHPFLVGGTDRFDTVLMEETGGSVLAKVGAEGVHTIAALDAGIALAVKVEDGSARAQYPAVLRLLQMLDVLPDELPARLAPFLRTPTYNTRGVQVGEVHVEE